MSALLVAIGLVLGTAAPASLAVITPLQWALLGINVAGDVRQAVQLERSLAILLRNPSVRLMLAANGEAAIRWQDRQMEY